MNILDASTDMDLFGRWFAADSWRPWRVFLAALFGLPMPTAQDVETFTRHTGRRQYAVGEPAREGWVVVGRRGGKSRVAALVAVFLACFRDYSHVLAPGEVGTLAVIAADRRQSRVVMRYIVGFLEAVPMLKAMVVNRTKETIELSNRVVIEVHTASFRAVRGYTLIGVICDEIAFWGTDDAGANPDTEILAGLRPGMATVPGALLLCISSPYARRGALWEAYRQHYGKDNDAVLVWQADTRAMNCTVDPQVIADAYEQDEAAASAEFGALFRRDIASFITRETVDACVIPDRHELPPAMGRHTYRAFCDPSGGSIDSMTLAVAHYEPPKRKSGSSTENGARGRVVLDVVREARAPFDPSRVVSDFAGVLRAYGIASVRGDRYGGAWPADRFREHNILYAPADKTKSQIYVETLPLLTSGQVELLDNRRLVGQLLNLERRTSRAGKDSIDHGPGAHDDLINAAAGALLACRRPRARGMGRAVWG